MKTSFSLSSLRGSGTPTSPTGAAPPAARPYNSLTKKRKQTEHDGWRRYWSGSMPREENKDDFWAALQPNYNYIMDNHLIESCTEANGELQDIVGEMCNFRDLATQFSELYSWLNNLQESVYAKEDIKSTCIHQMEEMEKKSYRRAAFVEQATRLVQVYPEIKDEVGWRITHLNSKWDTLKQAISLADPQDNHTDVDYEIRCLRKWMHEMESRLQPLTFRHDWTLQELDGKALEHRVLQKDIESHGKIVSSVLKLCERSVPEASVEELQRDANARRALQGLERRWHLLFLRSLEWQCHIETLYKRFVNSNPGDNGTFCDSESDEEPAFKQPRLSSACKSTRQLSPPYGFGYHNLVKSAPPSTTSSSDNEISNSSESDGESYFEDGIEETCILVSTTTEATREMSVSQKPVVEMSSAQKRSATGVRTPRQTIEERKKKQRNHKAIPTEECAPTTKIDYNGPNNVTYYCQHRDTDSGEAEMQTVDQSSEDEWTFTSTVPQRHRVTPLSDNTANRMDPKLTTPDTVDSPDRKPLPPTKLSFSPRPPQNTQKLSKDELHRLVHNAEILVSTPAKVRKPIIEHGKYRRVKEWLNRSNSEIVEPPKVAPKVEDNCDASGEYTTGESDGEKESQSSEELNGSVATFRHAGGYASQATSTEVITEMESTPTSETVPHLPSSEPPPTKINYRTKRNQMRSNRPWSVACISALASYRTPPRQQPLNNFSISESALHELAIASMSARAAHLTSSVNNIVGAGPSPNSPDSHLKTSTIHRKKLRVRKTHTNRKSESGSDGPNALFTPPIGRSLVKSGSFSGAATSKHAAAAAAASDRCTVSDPTNNLSTTYGTSPASGFESDEENSKPVASPGQPALIPTTAAIVPSSSAPAAAGPEASSKCSTPTGSSPPPVVLFKLGVQNPVTTIGTAGNAATNVDRDSSPDKTSLNTAGTEEHLSSMSEWDYYLEKYMSEPYSETPDSEAARKLLEFGEDYRNYIDSQSDCCSSLSAQTQSQSPPPLRRCWRPSESTVQTTNTAMDSDSDAEDFRHIIRESRAQFYFTNDVFLKQLHTAEIPVDCLQSDFADLLVTCRENLQCLQIQLKIQGSLLSTSELRDVKALLGSWSTIQAQASDLQRARTLDRQIAAMRTDLVSLTGRSLATNVQSRQELESNIDQLKAELALLQDRKRVLLHVNVAVHRFLTDCARLTPGTTPCAGTAAAAASQAATAAAAAHLKDRVADLYRLWTETYDSVSEQLNNQQGLHGVWSQFEVRLDELQGALRSDENTLKLLDTALKGGAVSADVAISVRDVAKVLSEKQNEAANLQKIVPKEVAAAAADGCGETLSHVDVSGSLSDSGISDEGSEQELSERERRLAVLRRLVRQLENALAPGSQALTLMAKRIEQTENELRDLQRTCRALIVRTAVCAEVRAHKQDASTATYLPPTLSKRKSRGSNATAKVSSRERGGGDPGDDPGRPSRPWLWRVLRASFPFQLAIVAIFCVACLLEPHCCDRINNLSMSFTPQLRYVKGPPPV